MRVVIKLIFLVKGPLLRRHLRRLRDRQSLIQLECKLFHLLQILGDCVVPVMGPWVDVTDPDSTRRCLDQMNQALLKGKNLSLPNWWVDHEAETGIRLLVRQDA
jgi:hypothetical protein